MSPYSIKIDIPVDFIDLHSRRDLCTASVRAGIPGHELPALIRSVEHRSLYTICGIRNRESFFGHFFCPAFEIAVVKHSESFYGDRLCLPVLAVLLHSKSSAVCAAVTFRAETFAEENIVQLCALSEHPAHV